MCPWGCSCDALALAAPAAGEEEESGGGSASAASAATHYALFLAGLRLVVIDALPTVIYPVLGGQRNFVGHAALSEVGARLHRLARARGLAALVLNSAVAGRGGEEGGAGEPGWHPSLGTTWSFVPDLSILVTRQHLCVGAPAAAAGGQAAPPAAPAAAAALRDTLAFAVLKSSRLYLGQSSGAAWDLMPEVLTL